MLVFWRVDGEPGRWYRYWVCCCLGFGAVGVGLGMVAWGMWEVRKCCVGFAVLCCAAATGELDGGGMWTGHFGIFTVDVRYCSSILSIIYAGRVVI